MFNPSSIHSRRECDRCRVRNTGAPAAVAAYGTVYCLPPTLSKVGKLLLCGLWLDSRFLTVSDFPVRGLVKRRGGDLRMSEFYTLGITQRRMCLFASQSILPSGRQKPSAPYPVTRKMTECKCPLHPVRRSLAHVLASLTGANIARRGKKDRVLHRTQLLRSSRQPPNLPHQVGATKRGKSDMC